MIRLFTIIVFALFTLINLFSQSPDRDKAKFIEYKNEFWNEIKESVEDFEKDKKTPQKSFRMDLSYYDLPTSTNEFKQLWHNDPISQGWSGMCWNFSTTSLFETEINRLTGKKIKISELYTTYWEYVEKARRFVQERGNSAFAEGSEANAVPRIWVKYGCVPAEVYSGLKPNQKFHGHEKMFNEMNSYLRTIKTTNAWNEETIINTIKSILNYYLGEPPKEFVYDEEKMTALEFFKNITKINPEDYVNVMSLMQEPYYSKAEYKVPDNWWLSNDYYNVPLDDFMNAIKDAIRKGYSMEIGGDISESGYDSQTQVAMIPSYDIPSDYIDEYARQLRFSNHTTEDDHGIHIVGYKEKDGVMWFLIKDSGSGSRNGTNKGYYFYHEDYIKLKMLTIFIHKSAIEDLLKKFKL